MERGWRDISPNCPRCGSSNTKFCYYNNYSLTQPRYFCKGCRRYWTKGGSLRNVPVGGGCRKSRRSRPSSLRLLSSSSSNHHNHHGGGGVPPARSSSTPTFIGHVLVGRDNNNNNNIHSYASDGNLSTMVESSIHSPNSEAPTAIDLAVVYANFLNQKDGVDDQLRSSIPFCDRMTTNESTMPTSEFMSLPNNNVDFSSIPDATTIVPSGQMINIMENNHLSTFSAQPLASSMPHLSNNQYFETTHFGGSMIETGLESELPPLPGESTSQDQHQHMLWNSSSSNNNNNNNEETMQESRKLVTAELEQDTQLFSNIYTGSWTMSPLLDQLPTFETSSSSSHPSKP